MKLLTIAAATALLATAACSNKEKKGVCGNDLSNGELASCTEGIKGERKTNGRLEGYWLAPEGMSVLNTIKAGKNACPLMTKTENGKTSVKIYDANLIMNSGQMLACSLPMGAFGQLQCVALEQPMNIDLDNGKVTGGPCDLNAKLSNSDVLTISGECGGIALFPITENGYRQYVEHGLECARKALGER